MDFHQLMQQASAKQDLVQKRHEMKKKVKEDERRKEAEEQREQQRKASRMLEGMKKASEKRQLEYRGVVQNQLSSTGILGNGSNRNGLNLTSEKSDNAPTSKQSPVSMKGKQKISSATTTKTTSPSSSSSLKSSKPDSSSSSSLKASKPASSSSSPKTAPKPKPPVDFKDLMKIAEKKTLQVAEKERMKSVVGDTHGQKSNTPASTGSSDKKPGVAGRGEREGSPLGKQLLEKSNSRARRKRTHVVMEREVEGERGEASGGSLRDSVSGSKRELTAVDRCTVGDNTRLSPQARGTPTERARPGVGGGERGRGGVHNPSVGRGRGAVRSGGKGEGLPESAFLMREKARQQLEAAARTQQANGSSSVCARPSAKTKSFYGGSHAQLSKEERPRFQTRPVSKPYQNSWVSEMSGYMQQVKDKGEGEGEEGGSEEEEEEMDDFVVDEVEEEEDYSSAIREIFGYDKRRFRDEEFDDRMMESSFAQQQFEEMRSSRIGWLEDQEDMKREAEQLARKRHKGMPPPAKMAGSRGKGLKQTKLSFR